MAFLLNRADAAGMYGGTGVTDFSELSVKLTVLDIQKSANRKGWTTGELQYTLVVSNLDEREPGDTEPILPIENVVITDIIEPTIATLVDNSVFIDGTQAPSTDYDYNPVTGKLIITLPSPVVVGTPRTITFRVEKAT